MRSHPGVAAKMFRTLAEEGINIQMITTSEIRISVAIDEAPRARGARPAQAHGLDVPLNRCVRSTFDRQARTRYDRAFLMETWPRVEGTPLLREHAG